MSPFSYIAAFDNNIYYTNTSQCSVTCCDMKETDAWTFKDESVLQIPRGITVDNDDNVYVAFFGSCKDIVISSDGKRYLELLSEKDGFRSTNVLDYDRSTNQLLQANLKILPCSSR